MSMQGIILDRGKQACEIYAVMTVETLVLGVDESSKEVGADFLILERCAVFLKVFGKQLAVGTVEKRRVVGLGVHYLLHRGRLAEQPQEIDVNSH